MSNIYKLVIDQAVVDEYNACYFSQHPRAKKPPIEKPLHPSINEWMILPRIQMNALKQKHKEFIVWYVNKLGLSNLGLADFTVTVNVYKSTRIRGDCDNYVIKFWDDGFVESGLIVDDDYKHMHSLTINVDVDKDNPRTEIIIVERNEEQSKS